jgi:alkylhydroperoxidase family enzyme
MELKTNLPGIVGLFAYSPMSAKPLKQLAEDVLRDPSFSPIPVGKREMIAALVSRWNKCTFCQLSHLAAAMTYIGDEADRVLNHADFSFENALYAKVAATVTNSQDSLAWLKNYILPRIQAGPKDDEEMKELSDKEIHDITLIASMFNMYPRYVLGMDMCNPDLQWSDYQIIGKQINEVGYAAATP